MNDLAQPVIGKLFEYVGEDRGPYGVDPAATRCAIANDEIAKAKRERERPAMKLRDVGPRSRREFLSFMRLRDGQPG